MAKNRLIQTSDIVCGTCRLVRTDLVKGNCRNCTEQAKSRGQHERFDFGFWFWAIVLLVIILTEPLRDQLSLDTD